MPSTISFPYSSNPKDTYLYVVKAKADARNATLHLSFVNTKSAATGGSSHVLITGVAVEQNGEISGSVTSVTDSTTNALSHTGLLDWAYWHSSLTEGWDGTPTNEKQGGTMIGLAAPVSGGSLRGASTTYTAANFSFTDGTSPASGTLTHATGILNTSLGSNGVGVFVPITLPTTHQYAVDIWVSAYRVTTATITATLPRTGSWIPATVSGTTASPKDTFHVSLLVKPGIANDVLTFSIVNTVSDNSDPLAQTGHVIISGVAIHEVPPQGTLVTIH